jgi:LmbE family N-acetylglucosaminyl deacetylase
LPANPAVGIHPDHLTVADAVRRVAYMINVPHAFLDEYPTDDERQSRWVRTPVILTTYDEYMGSGSSHDLAIDVSDAFDSIARQSWCHQSQIREWLPWVGRHEMSPPANLAEWETALRGRFHARRSRLELGDGPPVETFSLTAWGEIPTAERLLADFPPGDLSASGHEVSGLRPKAF